MTINLRELTNYRGDLWTPLRREARNKSLSAYALNTISTNAQKSPPQMQLNRPGLLSMIAREERSKRQTLAQILFTELLNEMTTPSNSQSELSNKPKLFQDFLDTLSEKNQPVLVKVLLRDGRQSLLEELLHNRNQLQYFLDELSSEDQQTLLQALVQKLHNISLGDNLLHLLLRALPMQTLNELLPENAEEEWKKTLRHVVALQKQLQTPEWQPQKLTDKCDLLKQIQTGLQQASEQKQSNISLGDSLLYLLFQALSPQQIEKLLPEDAEDGWKKTLKQILEDQKQKEQERESRQTNELQHLIQKRLQKLPQTDYESQLEDLRKIHDLLLQLPQKNLSLCTQELRQQLSIYHQLPLPACPSNQAQHSCPSEQTKGTLLGDLQVLWRTQIKITEAQIAEEIDRQTGAESEELANVLEVKQQITETLDAQAPIPGLLQLKQQVNTELAKLKQLHENLSQLILLINTQESIPGLSQLIPGCENLNAQEQTTLLLKFKQQFDKELATQKNNRQWLSWIDQRVAETLSTQEKERRVSSLLQKHGYDQIQQQTEQQKDMVQQQMNQQQMMLLQQHNLLLQLPLTPEQRKTLVPQQNTLQQHTVPYRQTLTKQQQTFLLQEEIIPQQQDIIVRNHMMLKEIQLEAENTVRT